MAERGRQFELRLNALAEKAAVVCSAPGCLRTGKRVNIAVPGDPRTERPGVGGCPADQAAR